MIKYLAIAVVAAPGFSDSLVCATDPTASKGIWPAQVPRS